MKTLDVAFSVQISRDVMRHWPVRPSGRVAVRASRGTPSRVLGLVGSADSEGIDLPVDALWESDAGNLRGARPVFQDIEGMVWTDLPIIRVMSMSRRDWDGSILIDGRASRIFVLGDLS